MKKFCTRCGDTGQVQGIDKSDPSGLWHSYTEPCRCTRKAQWWIVVALVALLLGVAPAVYLGLFR